MADRKYGLQQVWPPRSDEEAYRKVEFDVVAVHGLDTQSPTTWDAYADKTDQNGHRVNWLKDDFMLPKQVPNARILTYEWNANTFSGAAVDDIFGHAKTLLRELELQTSVNAVPIPLVIVASCFGGLLVAKALLQARAYDEGTPARRVLDRVIGVIFLGTPFQGSKAAKSAQVRVQLVRSLGKETHQSLIDDLLRQNGRLDELVRAFTDLVHRSSCRIPIKCFYEKRYTNVTKALGWASLASWFPRLEILVPMESACVHGSDPEGLEVNHTMLVKYRDPGDIGFKSIAATIRGFFETYQESKVKAALGSLPNGAQQYLNVRIKGKAHTGDDYSSSWKREIGAGKPRVYGRVEVDEGGKALIGNRYGGKDFWDD